MKGLIHWLQLTAALVRLITDIARFIYTIIRMGWV